LLDGIRLTAYPTRSVQLKFVPGYYAPKFLRPEEPDERNSHLVVCGPCNFKCCYCDYHGNPEVGFRDFSDDDFRLVVRHLFRSGSRFKFTGGEPCLNVAIGDMLAFVKGMGGTVYLDSNGSFPGRLEKLVGSGLVDVVGLSLKGLSPEESMTNAGVTNRRLVWENPLAAIGASLAASAEVIVIVTYIPMGGDVRQQVFEFAQLLERFGDRVRLKVNCIIANPVNQHLQGASGPELIAAATDLVNERQEWKGRVIVIPSQEAITTASAIRFL